MASKLIVLTGALLVCSQLPMQAQQLRNGLGDATEVTSPLSTSPYGINDPNNMTSRNSDVFTVHKHADDTSIGSSTFQTQEATISTSPALRTQVFTPTAPMAVTAPSYLRPTTTFSQFMTSSPATSRTFEVSPSASLSTVLSPAYTTQTQSLQLNSAFTNKTSESTFMDSGSSLSKSRFIQF